MAKIIHLWDGRGAMEGKRRAGECQHRRVIAWRAERVVRCEICGALLDPFDVLVDLLQRLPPQGEDG